jgi:hypothetical protein
MLGTTPNMTVAANCRRHRNTREDVRASAGIGIKASEPADWLFGDTHGEDRSG